VRRSQVFRIPAALMNPLRQYTCMNILQSDRQNQRNLE
jgi:hypothetical protein